jgi:hypothetical protein
MLEPRVEYPLAIDGIVPPIASGWSSSSWLHPHLKLPTAEVLLLVQCVRASPFATLPLLQLVLILTTY